MEIRIGMIHVTKEIVVELSDETDRDALKTQINESLTGQTPTLWLTDVRGRQVGVSSQEIGYVELEGDQGERPVGFG